MAKKINFKALVTKVKTVVSAVAKSPIAQALISSIPVVGSIASKGMQLYSTISQKMSSVVSSIMPPMKAEQTAVAVALPSSPSPFVPEEKVYVNTPRGSDDVSSRKPSESLSLAKKVSDKENKFTREKSRVISRGKK